MPEPQVVIAVRQFKAALLAREAAQVQVMAGRWLRLENRLEAEIQALAYEFDELRRAGKAISRRKLYQMDRYKRLLAQTQAEFSEYATWAGEEITRQQAVLARLGLQHSQRAIQLSFYPQVGAYFDRLPIEAVQNMVGLAGNGAPIGELLKLRMVRDAAGLPLPGVWERLTQTLIDGTGMGWNPRKTARLMFDDLAGGLNKSLVIARTEQLRVYRMVATEQYVTSGVVRGQQRLTAHDRRVCPACIADEATVYPLTAIISDHPCGRCTSVPVLINRPALSWTSGETWFRQQPVTTQRAILGPGHYEAWKDGQFAFKDLTKHTDHPVWGGGLQVRPLQELVA